MPLERGQHRFGSYVLDSEGGRLWQGTQEVELSPRAFQVLCYLIQHRERVVSKQELMQAIWKDTFVTDDALVQAVTAIRRALGDDAEKPRYIRTKARMGYQFVAGVQSGRSAEAVEAWRAPVGRTTARALLLAIQAGYLLLYGLTLYYIDSAAQVAARSLDWAFGGGAVMVVVVFLALAGTAVRLYLIATVAFDHPQTGAKFLQLFPLLLLLDVIWALSPLLVAEKTGYWLALALVPVLAYGPFSQRTLIRSAYAAPHTSG